MSGYKNNKKAKIISIAGSAVVTVAFVGMTVFSGVSNYIQNNFFRPKPEKIDPIYGIVDSTNQPNYPFDKNETTNKIPSDREEHTVADEVGIVTEDETTIQTEESTTRPTRPNEEITEPDLGANNDFVYQPQPDAEKNPTSSSTAESEHNTETEDFTEPGVDTETNIETETDYEDITETEVTTQETVEILSTLTSWLQEYLIESNNLSSTPDLTVIGVDTMSIDENNNTFQINGTIKTSSKMRTFTFDVTNSDSKLQIFNLPANLNASTLNDAFNQVKVSQNTKESLKFGQFISIENQASIISSILRSRYEDVSKINADTTRAETAYLTGVLNNINSCSIRVSTPSKIQVEDGFRYSFYTLVNTGKYTYSTTHYFESDKELKDTELQTYVNNYLKSGVLETTTYVTSNSAVNQFIHQINERAEEKNADNTLSK